MRPLSVVDVGNPRALWEPLSQALFDGGPAILPRPGGARISHTAPLEVADDVAVVIETSGTTGAPKRVALSADAILAGAHMTHNALGAGGTWLLALPAHYIAGVQVCVRAHLSGTEPIFLHPEPFSSTAIAGKSAELDVAAEGGALYTSLVPAQLRRLMEDARQMPVLQRVLQRFDAILVGGQALPTALYAQALEAGLRVRRTYGSSETAGGCVWDGVALPGVDIAEWEGRIALSGPMVASGYLENPEKTATSFVEREGKRWYLTDDQGAIDSSGLLSVTGRVDDVMISGGVKVSLAEIERVIQHSTPAHDGVVVAAPSETWGQVPVLVTTVSVDLEQIRAMLATAIGPHARVERFIQVAEIPLLGSGKPDRVSLHTLAQAGLRG